MTSPHSSIYFFSHADTDLLVLLHCAADLQKLGISVEGLSLQKTSAQNILTVCSRQEPAVLVFRLLSTPSEVPGLLDAIQTAKLTGKHVIALSGAHERNGQIEALSTVHESVVQSVAAYLGHGGTTNTNRLLKYLGAQLLGANTPYEPPSPLPAIGIYHPALGDSTELADWLEWHSERKRPVVGISFYRAHWLSRNTGFIDELVHALDNAGLDAFPVFTPSIRATDATKSDLPEGYQLFSAESGGVDVDAIVNTTSFSIADLSAPGACQDWSAFKRLNAPIVQAICSGMTEHQWADSTRGLSALDTAMNVVMSEFDGRIITVPFSFRADTTDAGTYSVRTDRAARIAGLVARLVALRRKPVHQRRIAFILTNASGKAGQVGNAVGLDAPASLCALVEAMRDCGYSVGELPADSDRLMHELINRCSYDVELLSETQCNSAVGRISLRTYRRWFDRLPVDLQQKMSEMWGQPPGCAYTHDGDLIIAGLDAKNIGVFLQPPRGYGFDPDAIYHQPDLPPTHHYFAFYRWLDEIWNADAIVHMGKHGTLEWLPGKGIGLSQQCFPDALLADMPLIYPFVINDPGEGSQAKRRAHAVVVDHLPPPLMAADAYGELAELQQLLDEYYEAEVLDPAKLPLLRERIYQLIQNANLQVDIKLRGTVSSVGAVEPPAGSNDEDTAPEPDAQFSQLLQEIDGYLCELSGAQIRNGLHILGRTPAGEALIDELCAITRLPNSGIPGLHEAIAEAFGLEWRTLLDAKGRRLEPSPELQALANRANCPIRTSSDAVESIELLARRLYTFLAERQFDQAAITDATATVLGEQLVCDNVEKTLVFALCDLLPNLQRTTDEIAGVLKALSGGFVEAGPSGAPSRGMAHILPTGKNFYSVDPRNVPSPSAWIVGEKLADEVVKRFSRETGTYPENICISMWGTNAMRTHGDDIAEVLALIGVKPVWHPLTKRIVGTEVIPIEQLGRPRIDVVIRISGLFRDAFPHLIALMDQALNQVMSLDEGPDVNLLRKHLLEEMTERLACGATADDAERRARYRIFGSKPGTYGAGILGLIQERNWTNQDDFATAYLNWGGYAYTATQPGDEARADFSRRLRVVDIAVQNQDNREHDIFDSDDYFQFHGGVIATIRSLSGRDPKRYFGDSHDPSRAAVRDLKEECLRVFRTRVVNPKWLAAIRRHGYKGALEMSATVDYLFGYDATANVMEDWMYEQVAQSYVLSPEQMQFLSESNPWAARAMSERLLESAQRGLWQQPDPETLNKLRAAFLESETQLEAKGERPANEGAPV